MSNKMTEMATEFRALKDRKEALDAEVKTINKRLRVLREDELPEYMEENEIEKVTIEGVGTIFIQQQLYANVKADDRSALYEHLRQSGNEDLIVDYVWPNTLKAWSKEQIVNGKPLPELITAHFVPTAMIRR
jgi:hypothetical protein